MRQVTLGAGLRILLGLIGAAAVIAGVVVGVAATYSAFHGAPWPAMLVVLFCVVVICGGALLLHGAWRGRTAVRDPGGRRSREPR